MNTLFKSLFALSLCLFCFSPSFGQTSAEGLSDEQKTELQEGIQSLVVSLELTEAQKVDFTQISEKYGPKLLALKESDASRFSKYRQFKSISKSRNKEMKKILSKDQYALYLEKQQEMQEKMKASRQKR